MMPQAAYPKTTSMNLRQALLLASTLVLSRYSTFLPQVSARVGGSAGWLLPVVTLIPLALCLCMGCRLLRGQEELRLDRAFAERLPRPLYRLCMGLYALAGLLYCAVYLRLYVSKLSVMIFFEASPHVFSVVMLAVVGLILTAAPVVLARINGLVSLFMAAVLWMLTVLLLPGAEWGKLYPVTGEQLLDIFPAGLGMAGVWMYVLLPFLCGDAITVVGRPVKTTVLFCAGMAGTVCALTAVLVGQLGPDIASRLYLPILFALRDSDISLLERSEVLLVTLWVLGDAMFLCIMARMALHTAGEAAGRPFRPSWILPGLAFVFVLSFWLGENSDHIQRLTENLFIPLNLLFGLGLPALALMVGPLYRRIRARRDTRQREQGRISTRTNE